MTPELRHIVDDAYRVFSGYELHRTLTVCHCNCCMTEETERELIRTPLRKISSHLLAEYTNSAHDWDDGPVACQMRYFLPRYLELLAEDDPPDSMGVDICLRRMGNAGWRAKWPSEEVDLIDAFFDALMVASLSRLDLSLWPAGWRLSFDLTDVLTLVVTAAGDLGRVLAVWDKAESPGAAVHMAALRDRLLVSGGRTYLHSAYLERSHDREADMIGAFLTRPEVNQRIEVAFFEIEDPRLQKILSDGMLS
ncbi:MAG TPA: hypothetical protein PKE13_14005 [Hyphomicrobium zavarzinii]|nr:hypothetical protein [Hyphomicrobium zavarzinii]